MKMMKKLCRAAMVLVVILVIGAVAFMVYGNQAIRAGIELAATQALKVPVSLEKVKLSLFRGSVTLGDLVVDNLPGYQHEKMLELGSAHITVDMKSLLSDRVLIDEIKFDDVTVVLEQKAIFGNNIQEVLKGISSGSGAGEEEATDTPGKKLHIRRLELNNISVKIKLLPVPGKADTVTLRLTPIVMNDLGSDDKLDIAVLSSKILGAIVHGIAEQGVGLIPDEILGLLTASLKGLGHISGEILQGGGKVLEGTAKILTEQGANVLEGGGDVLEEGGKIIEEAGKGITEGIKGLLNPKKDDE